MFGTFASAGLIALAAHTLLGFSWITSGLGVRSGHAHPRLWLLRRLRRGHPAPLPASTALAVIGGVDDGQAIYGIVFVVVLFSVLVQGTFVPFAAARLGVPMTRSAEPQS